MRNIVLALIIAVGACALLYLLATVLGFPAEVAKGAAGLPAFSIQKVYEFLETSSAKHALETTGLSPTMSVKEFSIHPLSWAISAQCPVCAKADTAGRFMSTRPSLRGSRITHHAII